jgi:hypothetical protein
MKGVIYMFNFFKKKVREEDPILKGAKRTILYVVHGNTYYDGYGHEENIFGVYTKKNMAEAAKDMVIKELYEKEVNRDTWIGIKDMSDIEVEILEIESDTAVDIYLGGCRY